MNQEINEMILFYSFSKGFGKPVPMDYYDLVLAFLRQDSFYQEVIHYETLSSAMQQCLLIQPTFKEDTLNAIENYQEDKSRILAKCLLKQVLIFNFYDLEMCGIVGDNMLGEDENAWHFGKLASQMSFEKIMEMLHQPNYRIVMLQSDSLGKDVDLSQIQHLPNITIYETTEQSQVRNRIIDANIVITNKNLMNKDTLEDLNQLKLICLTATGVNNVDLDYCRQHHIQVRNIKGYSTDTVAQHTLALALHLIEKNKAYDDYVKTKAYARSQQFSFFDYHFHDISSLTWGIVGLGAIGRKVAHIASVLGAKVQYYSTSGNNSTDDYMQVDFDTLLQTSDIISIHAPLNEQTHYLFNEETLLKMKPSAYLINVGRGGIIEEKALVKVLNEGHLGGVGLDVFEHEPLLEDDMIYHIEDMDKVILTPHVGWGSIEARQRCVDETYQNVMSYINDEDRNIVV
ncbi:MAG: D-2-hydroxyacid dehydrogenase [Erysipelotrichaceae bacterium]|nr:D-2-hydroxyacid dehydrogenase [Erysipelotrichaceae bacterium]